MSSNNLQLPEAFKALEPWVAEWSIPHESGRLGKRLSSNSLRPRNNDIKAGKSPADLLCPQPPAQRIDHDLIAGSLQDLQRFL